MSDTATLSGTIEASYAPLGWKPGLLKSLHKLFHLTNMGCRERFDSDDLENVSTELVYICETVMRLSKADQIICVEEIGESVTKLAPFLARVYYGESKGKAGMYSII